MTYSPRQPWIFAIDAGEGEYVPTSITSKNLFASGFEVVINMKSSIYRNSNCSPHQLLSTAKISGGRKGKRTNRSFLPREPQMDPLQIPIKESTKYRAHYTALRDPFRLFVVPSSNFYDITLEMLGQEFEEFLTRFGHGRSYLEDVRGEEREGDGPRRSRSCW